MSNFLYENLKKGFAKFRSNPQLMYTIVVAVVIVGAFAFMADRFVGIANDAQERLVNVRVGALQDAFVSFAGDKLNEPKYLDAKIQTVVSQNPTIQSFRILVLEQVPATATSTPRTTYVIIASNKTEEVSQTDPSAQFLYTLASSDPNHSLTVQTQERDGRLFNTARAIPGPDGSVVAVVMTTQTLSEADKAIQNNINNSIGLLLIILIVMMLIFLRHSKIIDYMALYQKLQEVDQLKDDFISMASHELRTPLSIIRGYAEFIREAPGLTGETKDYAQKIDISVKGLDLLVADILDVSRIEQGRMSYTFETISPKMLTTEVVESFVAPGKEKGLVVVFDASKATDTQKIRVDVARLRQVLVNLVGNAVKYTVRGGVTISQSVEKGRLYIRVSDTGLGMSGPEREKLFTKFYRIRTQETENIRGTGLGLWITAQIIKEMNGTIAVESIKGVGSHFILSFPTVN